MQFAHYHKYSDKMNFSNLNLPFKKDYIFRCIDDAEPSFEVKMWINKGELYRCIVTEAVSEIISGEAAFQWEDMDGNIIIPNGEIGCEHIKLKRFISVAEIPLN